MLPIAQRRITTEPVATNASGLGFDYLIKWSAKRRSLAIEIHASNVIVRAPLGISRKHIDDFIVSRREWITAKLGQQQKRHTEIPVRDYSHGAEFPWLGETYKLHVSRGTNTQIRYARGTIDICLAPRAQLANQLRLWYFSQAQQLLIDKTHFYAEELGVTVTQINFRLTKSKWGHCTRNGHIQYNWMIALAPEPIVDYLVAHEVSHRLHFNHSAAFWNTVAKLHPDYTNSRQWLKRYGHTLIL